ncbi:hypothetical protein L3Y34_014066 [Caenorhabditis briggsae]|uniref:Rap-GAP domain-containing protein n=1 Tax=Caenorhabditis briggsae TaxID=6238 RepID=A0AAE9DPV1_CAEBR|nr:hypothetical protein L3Y34_014066 [Caenorhabditis briggsae]
MFARKGKSSDVQASISRFTDLNRDCVSRVKHLKILLDTLTTNEKRQLLDEHSFETFHLVDELLLANDVSSQIDSAIEAESGLWTLEQVLCLAPELVGSGWQRHAIESLLKKAVYPKNLMAVRKIAIRLFLVFYQCLGVYGKATPDLDRVFQCLLPFFPLKSGENAEDVLNEYCQSSGTGDWVERLRNGPIKSTASPSQTSKERAQMLQVYLDKFLEYCTRETVRIEWNDEGKRQECANFIIDKVIKLYMGECFTELETNGVDVFGGWEGADEQGEPLDTADPVVIARYWLIRWINNIASATHQPANNVPQSAQSSLILYRNALFSSHKATNVALTLMREAMKLPLACSNVTHKVVNVLSAWLLQYEIPPFVASGEVSIERCSLLLANILLSFFHSPYLSQCGERHSSAISIAFAILTSCKQLVSHRIQLPKPLPQKFWSELMAGLCAVASKICHQSDVFSQHVSAAFTSTLISNVVIIKAVRRIEIDNDVWDEVHEVMKRGVWIPMAEQWAAIVNSVTRALILHLAHIDIFSREEALRKATEVSQTSRRQAIESAAAMMEEPRKESLEGGDSMSSTNTLTEDNVFHDTDDITNAVTSWSGDKLAWLQTWRRVISLVDPYTNSSAHVAIDCMSLTIKNLLSVNLHPLAHWLACRLVTVPPILLPRCVPALSAILNESVRRPPPLLSANILLCFIRLMQSKEQLVVPAICGLSASELSIVAPRALEHLPKMLRGSKDGKSKDSLKLFAMLSSSYPGAEQILLEQLVHTEVAENAVVIVNTLATLIVQKAQIDLVLSALKVIETHQFAMRLIPLFCMSIAALAQFSSTTLLQALLRAASLLRDERTRTEIEWQMVKLCVQWPQPQMPLVIRGILADRHMVLNGELVQLGGQYPIRGFDVSKWNSTAAALPANEDKMVYINRQSAIISLARRDAAKFEITSRTVVGRHIWDLDTLDTTMPRHQTRHVTNWLRKEALKGKKAGRESQGILGAMDDPFDDLPRAPSSASNASSSKLSSPVEGSAQFASMIETSRRQPQPLGSPNNNNDSNPPAFQPNSKLLEWRSLSASLGFVPLVSQVHTNFLRDLKHLDQTSSREVHKIAVIYVGDTQEDRASILSNTVASPQFDAFVGELGWEIRVGRGHEGYNGGLPVETRAPYYADAESEAIFHVSTWLNGDVQQKWKHIGNDEVHVVWTENYRKVYTRETIATKFCDVLIVLEHVGDKMVRVRVDTASALEFGPLFDGALVTMSELSQLVRLTVINASRAYRMARVEHSRPLRHREEVFCNEALGHMRPMALAQSINHLYVPTI